MKVNLSQVLQTFWDTIGKPSTSKILSTQVATYIHTICRKYNMREDHEFQLAKSVSELVLYVSNAKLNKEKIDTQLVLEHIKGPIAQSLIIGASSVNNSENFISEILSKVNETDLSNVETFFSSIGMSDTSLYVNTLKDVLVSIKDGRPIDSSSSNQIEENIPYAEVINSADVILNKRNHPENTVYEGMTEQEENAFIQNLSGRFVGQKLNTPVEAINMVNTFVEAIKDVAKFTEIQKTKRAEIRAQAEVRIKEIDSMRDLIMTYLDKTFDERSKIFAKQFECIDKALADGDANVLAISLNSITDLAKSSPFKALADIKIVQKQLTADNTTFDI